MAKLPAHVDKESKDFMGQVEMNEISEGEFIRIHEKTGLRHDLQKALPMSNAKSDETLFVDDSLRNIEGAAKARIQGVHLKAGMGLFESVKVRLNPQVNHSSL